MNWTLEIIIAGVSALTAIGATCVSIWAIVSARSASKHANSLQKTIVDIEKRHEEERLEEQKKAKLSTRIVPEIQPNGIFSNLLVIRNNGKCAARNVRIVMKSLKKNRYDKTEQKEYSALIIAADSESSQRFAFLPESGPFIIDISWDDDFKEDRHYQHSISL
jgi:hypothetical protein